MQDGPWNFRGNIVILTPYDGVTKPSMVALNTLNIWIQIHDVPDKFAHLVTCWKYGLGAIILYYYISMFIIKS